MLYASAPPARPIHRARVVPAPRNVSCLFRSVQLAERLKRPNGDKTAVTWIDHFINLSVEYDRRHLCIVAQARITVLHGSGCLSCIMGSANRQTGMGAYCGKNICIADTEDQGGCGAS